MSWNAYLVDDRGHTEGDWNYTHNCNHMAHIAAEEAGIVFPADTAPCYALPKAADGRLTYYPDGKGTISWWKHLDGMSGPDGAAYLDQIIRGLEADPERFRAKNPSNGWGDYDTFLKVLTEMRDAVPEWPTEWSVNG
jgi:hypothetical protein